MSSKSSTLPTNSHINCVPKKEPLKKLIVASLLLCAILHLVKNYICLYVSVKSVKVCQQRQDWWMPNVDLK